MISGFATTYKDNNGLTRIYFYPGYDDYGRIILRIEISNADYKFIKYKDKAVEYTLLNPDVSEVTYTLINNITKEIVVSNV